MSLFVLKCDIPSHDREWLQFTVDISYLVNCRYYQKLPKTPKPTKETVRFDPRVNVESTDCISTLLINEEGECKDISSALAAYYTIILGIPAVPTVVPVCDKDGVPIKGKWHCFITMNGKEYDPNFLFGMERI